LVLAINNIGSTGTVPLALKASVYQEVNLVLARTLVETRDSGEMRRLVKWIEAVTMEGRNPFFAIELVGNIRTCGCCWADVAQNTRHFIMADDQRDEMLQTMVKDMPQKGTLESVVYNGIITLEQAYYAARMESHRQHREAGGQDHEVS
jgi:hypothetical protein